jgi:hypothetical protein
VKLAKFTPNLTLAALPPSSVKRKLHDRVLFINLYLDWNMRFDGFETLDTALFDGTITVHNGDVRKKETGVYAS